MELKRRNRIQHLQLSTVKMQCRDYERLNELIQYGGAEVAQKEYELAGSSYDEDAGVFTDYGMNEAARTWANIHFTQLLGMAILQGDFPDRTDDEPNPEGEVMFLHMGIPAVVHFLMAMDDETQRNIWKQQGAAFWESDGHYGGGNRQEFVEKWANDRMLDRKKKREIVSLLQDKTKSKPLGHYLKQAISKAV